MTYYSVISNLQPLSLLPVYVEHANGSVWFLKIGMPVSYPVIINPPWSPWWTNHHRGDFADVWWYSSRM